MLDVRNLTKNICLKGKNKNLFNKIYKVVECSNKKESYEILSQIITDLLSDPMTQKVTIDLIKGSKTVKQLNANELLAIYKILYMKYNNYIQNFSRAQSMSLNQMKDWLLEA